MIALCIHAASFHGTECLRLVCTSWLALSFRFPARYREDQAMLCTLFPELRMKSSRVNNEPVNLKDEHRASAASLMTCGSSPCAGRDDRTGPLHHIRRRGRGAFRRFLRESVASGCVQNLFIRPTPWADSEAHQDPAGPCSGAGRATDFPFLHFISGMHHTSVCIWLKSHHSLHLRRSYAIQ